VKVIQYFWIEGGKLFPIDESHDLIKKVKWQRDETLKIEVWPCDLKLGPCTQIPYGNRKQRGKRVKEIIELTARSKQLREETWSNNTSKLWVDKTRTPYSEEFTKRDDARNRAYLSKGIPKGRKTSEIPPTQDDAPF
jgi:hypothetical protein